MFNTKNVNVGSGKIKPIMDAGNQTVKINSITFDAPPYDANAVNIYLNLETPAVEGEFEGFLVDSTKPNGPRYAGQVARVKLNQYAFASKVLPSGVEIIKEDEILKAFARMALALNVKEQLDQISAPTIEKYIPACSELFKSVGFFNICIGGREYSNKEGYTNLDLFVAKGEKGKYPFGLLDGDEASLLKFDAEKHIIKQKKQEAPASFSSPSSATLSDEFDLE